MKTASPTAKERAIISKLKNSIQGKGNGRETTVDVCTLPELYSPEVMEVMDGSLRLTAATYMYLPSNIADEIVLNYCGTHPCKFEGYKVKVGCESRDLEISGVPGNLVAVIGDVGLCPGPQEKDIPPFFRSPELLGLIYKARPDEGVVPFVVMTQNTRDMDGDLNFPFLGLSIIRENNQWTVKC